MTETITWIPVEERLPTEHERCLIFEPGYIGIGSHWSYGFVTNEYILAEDVTHWAEMPKGPK